MYYVVNCIDNKHRYKIIICTIVMIVRLLLITTMGGEAPTC